MPNLLLSLLLGSQLMNSAYSRNATDSSPPPHLRSGNAAFDELFDLTMSEVQANSVSTIRDGSFMQGQPMPCDCFETGELWHYVWTRDSAYAVDLGLAWLDPERSRQTLLFKVSEARQASRFGSGLEVVQDTGSGGSWPISTDRVAWGLGAGRLLPLLPEHQQLDFLQLTFETLKNTLETDRSVVYDRAHGLYRGEQSFLDWRQQSYPIWTANDVKAIGQSFALSTNVLHLLALRQASAYAERLNDAERRDRYAAWALDLERSIRSFFWLPDAGMFSSMSSATDLAFPLQKFDLLGQALAVRAGLVSMDEGRSIFSNYPLHRAGPPVIHPQLPDRAIYHNRAVWPFVTAYAIQAAIQVEHAPFVTEAMQSLLNGVAQHRSNMENFEFLSGRTFVEDGNLSGPVINSRRQLWSVAGFVSLIIQGLFGLEVEGDDLRIAPHLTHKIAQSWLAGGRLELRDFRWRGKRLHIDMQWPEIKTSSDGFLRVESLILNGETLRDSTIAFSQLAADNQLVVKLIEDSNPSLSTLNFAKVGPGPGLVDEEYERVFAPREPRLAWLDDHTLRIERRETKATRWDLYRDGRLFAANLNDESLEVPDRGCYTAVQTYEGGSLVSHPSPELCRYAWNTEFSSSNGALKSLDGASQANDHNRPHFNDWGRPHQILEVSSFEVPRNGSYRAEVGFGNAFGSIQSGVTAAVKWLEVIDADSGEIQSGAVFLPHQMNWDIWSWSSALALELKAGRRYKLSLSDARNMSYMKHFERYTAGRGGAEGALNRANVSGIRLRLVE